MNTKNSSMEKIMVRDNLYQYFFTGDKDPSINSIFACINRSESPAKALLIDTAFPEYAQMVKKDLEENGIQPEIVVLSHYHPDHTAGCTVFPGCPIYASEFYEDNLENCKRWQPNFTFLPATHVIKDGDTLSFGTFHIRFIHAPGHSRCHLMSVINNDILHVGDLLMFEADNKTTLPYISMGGSFKQHINSLERIKTLDYNIMLIPHGHVFTGKDKTIEEIDDRIYYLKRVLNSKGTLPVAVCLKKDISNYAHTEYHETNLIQLMIEE
ncbi:MAG: MBL fold metallo-hydrolase [Candidatus Aminicenantes bacterium]|nr:MBL fold metallo-hydrolase [Candidatus Aminicenantes bacterium]NIM78538.1 MBL fold metallo-hydrolase [Candidatus Aminicenantes bacterium]NIN17783.1 MBL fold metallo-hydrolase [Candidatus Aminicenantes bacterium]NIN41685.1 MBL fold metallo-hydrolase [Candidatus Aminicenantes bacterium]NIN84434.1 MBL fold metallo-hydrolase [Candidatus Aminicenantes bacterium]